MKQIAPHLRLAGTRIANVWILEDGQGRRFLIDSGHPIERPALLAELWRAGIRMPGDLTAVLLTHRHSDHAGNAAWVRKRFGARVICHANDAAALEGRVSPPPLVRHDGEAIALFGKQRLYERALCAYEDRAPALCEVDELYDEGAWKWGFRIVPVPGHTEGSVMLYHEPSRTLFSGDAILVGTKLERVLGRPLPTLSALGDAFGSATGALSAVRGKLPRLGLPKSRSRDLEAERAVEHGTDSLTLRLAESAFSNDAPSCHLAVRRFLRHLPPVDVLCSGHGPALDRSAQLKLERLLRA